MTIYPEQPLVVPPIDDASGLPIVAQNTWYDFGPYPETTPIQPLPTSDPWAHGIRARQLMAHGWRYYQDVLVISTYGLDVAWDTADPVSELYAGHVSAHVNFYSGNVITPYVGWNGVFPLPLSLMPRHENYTQPSPDGKFTPPSPLAVDAIGYPFDDPLCPNETWMTTDCILVDSFQFTWDRYVYTAYANPHYGTGNIGCRPVGYYEPGGWYEYSMIFIYSVLFRFQGCYVHEYPSVLKSPSIIPSLAGVGFLAALSGFVTGVSPTPGRRPKRKS